MAPFIYQHVFLLTDVKKRSFIRKYVKNTCANFVNRCGQEVKFKFASAQ